MLNSIFNITYKGLKMDISTHNVVEVSIELETSSFVGDKYNLFKIRIVNKDKTISTVTVFGEVDKDVLFNIQDCRKRIKNEKN